jgi:hypothetical protein
MMTKLKINPKNIQTKDSKSADKLKLELSSTKNTIKILFQTRSQRKMLHASNKKTKIVKEDLLEVIL